VNCDKKKMASAMDIEETKQVAQGNPTAPVVAADAVPMKWWPFVRQQFKTNAMRELRRFQRRKRHGGHDQDQERGGDQVQRQRKRQRAEMWLNELSEFKAITEQLLEAVRMAELP
jgi:hypothetical protein